MQFSFGTGVLLGKRTDVTTAQNVIFGTCESWDVNFDQTLVELWGGSKLPVDVAPADMKISGKIKYATLMASTFANLILPGATLTTNAGIDLAAPENKSSIAATTFVVTNGATFLEDFGVFYHATGTALFPVTAAPSAGQYIAGAAGVGKYTINSADQAVTGGLDVFYSYTTTGLFQVTMANVLMGTGAVFEMFGSVPYTVQGVAKKLTLKLNACRAAKLPLAFKNKAYLVPEMDFSVMADASGNIGTLSMSE